MAAEAVTVLEDEANEDPQETGFDCYEFLLGVLGRTEGVVGEMHANNNVMRNPNGHILTHLNLLDTTVKWLGQLMRIADGQDIHLLEDLQKFFLNFMIICGDIN